MCQHNNGRTKTAFYCTHHWQGKPHLVLSCSKHTLDQKFESSCRESDSCQATVQNGNGVRNIAICPPLSHCHMVRLVGTAGSNAADQCPPMNMGIDTWNMHTCVHVRGVHDASSLAACSSTALTLSPTALDCGTAYTEASLRLGSVIRCCKPGQNVEVLTRL